MDTLNLVIMSKIKITYLGSSSSGRTFEYGVTDDVAKELAIESGVSFSTVPGRELSFYSPTNCYLFAAKIGESKEVEIAGYTPAGSDRNINFFKGTDKAKQRRFKQSLKDQELLSRGSRAIEAGMSESFLFDAEERMLRIKKLQAELKKLTAE